MLTRVAAANCAAEGDSVRIIGPFLVSMSHERCWIASQLRTRTASPPNNDGSSACSIGVGALDCRLITAEIHLSRCSLLNWEMGLGRLGRGAGVGTATLEVLAGSTDEELAEGSKRERGFRVSRCISVDTRHTQQISQAHWA